MANQPNTIAENRFAVELNGIAAFKASKITGGEEKHEPVKVMVGNDPRAKLGRGNLEASDVVITIPSGLYDNSLRQLQSWVDRYFEGLDTAPRSGRYIVYDDAGRTPVETYEILDAVPVELKPDDKSADGNNAASVTLTLKPYKCRRI